MNKIHHHINSLLEQHVKFVAAFLAIFYTVGVLGLSFAFSFNYFVKLTPLALLLSFVILLFYHKRFTIKTGLIFTLIFLIGFGVELIGVQTKMIFGSYIYGDSLGLKILDTPLIIGLNWLLLVYLANSVLNGLKLNTAVKIFFASLILLAYDMILEQVAPLIHMWSWENETVPLQNYLAWFVLALVLSGLLSWGNINLKNRIAPVILICQSLFFILLLFILK